MALALSGSPASRVHQQAIRVSYQALRVPQQVNIWFLSAFRQPYSGLKQPYQALGGPYQRPGPQMPLRGSQKSRSGSQGYPRILPDGLIRLSNGPITSQYSNSPITLSEGPITISAIRALPGSRKSLSVLQYSSKLQDAFIRLSDGPIRFQIALFQALSGVLDAPVRLMRLLRVPQPNILPDGLIRLSDSPIRSQLSNSPIKLLPIICSQRALSGYQMPLSGSQKSLSGSHSQEYSSRHPDDQIALPDSQMVL